MDGHADKWEQAQAALSNAQSLEQYLDGLDQLVASPFATLAQREAVAGIDRLKIDQETLLGQLLLPNKPRAWPTLTNVDGLERQPHARATHQRRKRTSISNCATTKTCGTSMPTN